MKRTWKQERDLLYLRGETVWVKRHKNAAGTKIPRHSTECRNWQKASKYLESLNLLEKWEGRKAAKQSPAEKPKGYRLDEGLEIWLRESKDGKLREETTKEHWRGVVTAQFIRPMAALGMHYLAEPKASHCRELQAGWFKQGTKKKTGLKLNTIIGYRAPISTMYDWLIKHKELEDVKNPWPPIPIPKEIPATFEQLLDQRPGDNGIATLPLDMDGDENWQAIRKRLVPFLEGRDYKVNPLALRPQTFLTLAELLYATGFRRGDAVTFRPDLIDWKNEVTYQFENGEKVTLIPYSTLQKKTTGSVTVGLTPELAHTLRSLPLLPWRGKKISTAGLYPFWDGSKRTFKDYLDEYLNTPLRELGEALNLPGDGLHPHRFRDSFAVNLLNRGMRIEQVSKLLGHKSVKTTERHYSPDVLSRQKFLLVRQAAVRLIA